MDEVNLNDGLIITGDLEGEEIKGGKKIVYNPSSSVSYLNSSFSLYK